MDQSVISIPQQKSARQPGALFVFSYLLFISFESTSAPLEVGGGISALRFDNREFSINGRLLDHELGGLPGISGRIARQIDDFEWELGGSYHREQVNYTGQTQTGTPYNTQTRESLGDIAFRVGYPIGEYMPYAGLGYHTWKRDILPGRTASGTAVSGLDEDYRWHYVWAGLRWLALRNPDTRVFVDFGLVLPIQPEMDITSTASHVRLNPVAKTGFRLALPLQIQLSPQWNLTTTLYGERWEFDKSPVVNGWYEPDFITRNIGIDVRFDWHQ